MSGVTAEQARAMLEHFGHHRYVLVDGIAREGEPDSIGVSLLCAIGIAETGLRNIVGDGGHGRGWLQIDDRSFGSWLAKRTGCQSGTWTFIKGKRASDPGYCPGLTAATDLAIQLLRGNRAYGKSRGVPEKHLTQFMVAAYNCGAGNALAAYRRYGIDGIDHYTANGHYSTSVLANMHSVVLASEHLGWRS